jgi:hypothetical protein
MTFFFLQKNNTLKELNLMCNNIGPTGVEALAKALHVSLYQNFFLPFFVPSLLLSGRQQLQTMTVGWLRMPNSGCKKSVVNGPNNMMSY